MKTRSTKLKPDQIFALALQVKLMLADGDIVFLNDMATEKNLIDFVRLIELKQVTNNEFSENVA